MKVLLTTLNSKYIHSSLALRYLEKYSKKYIKTENCQIVVREFSINESLDQVMAGIYKEQADIAAFSCYIWNWEQTFELVDRLKKVAPDLMIIMGGPEVSYQVEEIMSSNPGIDIIIKGEGEVTFKELIDSFASANYQQALYETGLGEISGIELDEMKGIVYRNGDDKITMTMDRELLVDLDNIPLPYTITELNKLEHKIIYYETSRGCPFNCSYCLSSTIKGVRAFSIDRVKEDLLFFINNNVKLVKFVDRTFNYDKNRSREIFKFLINNKANTSFHFEISADILDDETIEILTTAPDGLFQFEIGVQSTNHETIGLINRKMNFLHLAENVRLLKNTDNINLHLDLIAGLPGEGYQSFKGSFDDVYTLRPHVLQLGFLKLLPGTDIRDKTDKYSYKYSSKPPYEVLQNRDISYQELLRLKDIAFIVDKYHNSGVFTSVLNYIFARYYNSYFSFYEDFANYFVTKKLHRKAHSRNSLYRIIYKFYKDHMCRDLYEIDIFREILKYDLIKYNSGTKIPDWAIKLSIEDFNDIRYKFLDSDENIKRLLPHYQGERVKDIIKNTRFELFKYDILDTDILDSKIEIDDIEEKLNVILYDYSNKDRVKVYNVTDFFDI